MEQVGRYVSVPQGFRNVMPKALAKMVTLTVPVTPEVAGMIYRVASLYRMTTRAWMESCLSGEASRQLLRWERDLQLRGRSMMQTKILAAEIAGFPGIVIPPDLIVLILSDLIQLVQLFCPKPQPTPALAVVRFVNEYPRRAERRIDRICRKREVPRDQIPLVRHAIMQRVPALRRDVVESICTENLGA